MTSNGVKRKANLEISWRNARERVSEMEEEVAEVKKVLAVTEEKLVQSKEAHAQEVTSLQNDHFKHFTGGTNGVISLTNQNQRLQQSLQAARHELKVWQQQLKQCKGNSDRAEKAERKEDSLSAKMRLRSEVGELTEDIGGTLSIELDGSSSVGGFKGVLQVLRAVRDRPENDSNDQVIMCNPDTATMKEGDTGEGEQAVVARVRAAEEEKEEVVKQGGAEEQLKGLKVRLEEEANKAAHEAGVYQWELEVTRVELDSQLKRELAAEERTGEALKQLGELMGGEVEQKLKCVERNREAALGESKRLRASLWSALEKHAAKG